MQGARIVPSTQRLRDLRDLDGISQGGDWIRRVARSELDFEGFRHDRVYILNEIEEGASFLT